MGPDWLDFLLRALAVIGMGYGAYQGYRRMHESGTLSVAAEALNVALLLLYICGGVLIVVVYAVTLAGGHLIAFLIIAGAYYVGGLYVWWKLAVSIRARFPPKGGHDPKSGGAESAGGSAETG
jgi:hypothetical protein